MPILLSSRSLGWLSLLLLGVVIALPYLTAATAGTGNVSASRWTRLPIRKMGFHYWLAPLVALGSLVHAWIPMASGRMPQTNLTGLWIATAALGLMFLQIGIGATMRSVGGDAKSLRRTHFMMMLGIVAMVAVHLWMNG
jgi:hypothetical protein